MEKELKCFHVYSYYYGFIGCVKAKNRKNALIQYRLYASNDSILNSIDMGGIYAKY
jgi:hypothetical protein